MPPARALAHRHTSKTRRHLLVSRGRQVSVERGTGRGTGRGTWVNLHVQSVSHGDARVTRADASKTLTVARASVSGDRAPTLDGHVGRALLSHVAPRGIGCKHGRCAAGVPLGGGGWRGPWGCALVGGVGAPSPRSAAPPLPSHSPARARLALALALTRARRAGESCSPRLPVHRASDGAPCRAAGRASVCDFT